MNFIARHAALIGFCTCFVSGFPERAFPQELSDVGMLACVVQIQRLEPSQPKAISEGVLAVSYSSGFLVRDPDAANADDSRVFLVTAAHNLVDCKDIRIAITATQTPSTPSDSLFQTGENPNSFRGRPVKPVVYFDSAEDIAVFEITDDWAPLLNKQKEKVVGTLLRRQPRPNAANQLPRGAIASAAGTVHEPDESTIHPAYSCTLSRYIQGWTLVPQAVDPVFSDADERKDPFAKMITDRIGRQKFLIIESMSITSGFSGSPVMISNDNFQDNGEIVAMVLGGTPDAQVGRTAWTIPAETISIAISTLKSQSTRFTDEPGISEVEKGKWLFNTSLAEFAQELGVRFRTPYKSRFNIESRIEFRSTKEDGKLCGNDLRDRIEKLPGRSFDFRRLEFDALCLDSVNLLTPRFYNCVFRDTKFQGSVLTGPTFVNCKFIDSAGKETSFSEVAKPPCLSCSPAALIAPIFKENAEDYDLVPRLRK